MRYYIYAVTSLIDGYSAFQITTQEKESGAAAYFDSESAENLPAIGLSTLNTLGIDTERSMIFLGEISSES